MPDAYYREPTTGDRKPGLATMSPRQWAGQPVPERDWVVEGLIPSGSVTMVSGDGGLGKSLLSLQLMTCCATGKEFFGRPTANVKSLGVFCEDEKDELHYRMSCITQHYGVDYCDLDDMHMISRVGFENTLFEVTTDFKDGSKFDTLHETTFYHQIWNKALECGAQLVILDSLHDMFAGNENDRRHARHFIGLLRRLALEIDGAVIINAHPSVAGMASGTGSAGSTAWNNAVRSRLYLTRPKDNDDPDVRELKTMKANYGPSGGTINLRWSDGAFATEGADAGLSWLDRSPDHDAVLEAVRACQVQGTVISLHPSQPTFAPKVLRSFPITSNIKPAKLVEILTHLVTIGRVGERQIGIRANRHPLMSLVEIAVWERTNAD